MTIATKRIFRGYRHRIFRADLLGYFGNSLLKMWRYRAFHPSVYAAIEAIQHDEILRQIEKMDAQGKPQMADPGMNQLALDNTVPDK